MWISNADALDLRIRLKLVADYLGDRSVVILGAKVFESDKTHNRAVDNAREALRIVERRLAK